MAKHPPHLLELAKRGADVRVRELLHELKLLTLSFPHLRDLVSSDDLPLNFLLRRGRDRAQAWPDSRRRRKMSAKARAAISAAQKARWAKQKALAKKS